MLPVVMPRPLTTFKLDRQLGRPMDTLDVEKKIRAESDAAESTGIEEHDPSPAALLATEEIERAKTYGRAAKSARTRHEYDRDWADLKTIATNAGSPRCRPSRRRSRAEAHP